MSYYVNQFDIGGDLQQPHNFVKINGMSPISSSPVNYHQRPNYRKRYKWLNPTKLGFNESSFDSLYNKREFRNTSATTVIINVSTGRLTLEFMKSNLFIKADNSKGQQLKPSLLILDHTNKPIQIFNLINGLGKFCIYFFTFCI